MKLLFETSVNQTLATSLTNSLLGTLVILVKDSEVVNAMRLPSVAEDASEELLDWLHNEFPCSWESGKNGTLEIFYDDGRPRMCVEPGRWVYFAEDDIIGDMSHSHREEAYREIGEPGIKVMSIFGESRFEVTDGVSTVSLDLTPLGVRQLIEELETVERMADAEPA